VCRDWADILGSKVCLAQGTPNTAVIFLKFWVAALIELAEDRQWRVRLAAQAHIPHLGKELGVIFFNEKVLPICLSWLNNCVFAIREAATKNFKNITVVFGVPWAKQTLLPKISAQSLHNNYLYRTVALTLITSLSEVFSSHDTQVDLFPILQTLASDPIANIRITSARALIEILPKLDPKFVKESVVPFFLDKLRTERDKDVIFFSNRALQIAGGN